MVINTKKGYFQIIKNHKKAFDIATFEECYIEECFDKYPYVVGDISDNILRLKGFSEDKRKDNYIGLVEKYIQDSCAFLCAHYILKKISKEEFEVLSKEEQIMPVDYDDAIPSMEKVPFDKESLVLESSPRNRVRINIDVYKQNKVTLGTLPANLREIVVKDGGNSSGSIASQKDTKEVLYYSSSSEGFEPPKTNNHRNNNYKGNNKNKSNQNKKPENNKNEVNTLNQEVNKNQSKNKKHKNKKKNNNGGNNSVPNNQNGKK